jgi:hypothetical protein
MTDSNLLAAERAAYRELLAAREDEAQSRQLEQAIFEAYLAASKSYSAAALRENAAFDAWYAASKALDQRGRPMSIVKHDVL